MIKELPDKKTLDILWTVATSSAIECDDKPHIIFARLLYYELELLTLKVNINK